MARGKWWRERHIGGRYAPRLLPVWPVAISAVFVAIILAAGIYFGLRAIAVPRPGPNGGPAVIDPIDVIKTTITVAGFVGAILVGVYGYRKQRLIEGDARRADAEQLAQRYTAAAGQLGHEKAAVRLAGVYAMAQLADDWVEQRQACIDVLCAYLRMPYELDTDSEKYREGEREVRLTIIRAIRDHLRDPNSPTTWRGSDLDFTGAVFDGGSFSGAQFIGGRISFEAAKFVAGQVQFDGVCFAGAEVSFGDGEGEPARFLGANVSFTGAHFTKGCVSMIFAQFTGGVVSFGAAHFDNQGSLSFGSANFDGTEIYFGWPIWLGAKIEGGQVIFSGASLKSGFIGLGGIELRSGDVLFESTKFEGAAVLLHHAILSGGNMDFRNAQFKRGNIVLDDKTEIKEGVVKPWPLPEGVIKTPDPL